MGWDPLEAGDEDVGVLETGDKDKAESALSASDSAGPPTQEQALDLAWDSAGASDRGAGTGLGRASDRGAGTGLGIRLGRAPDREAGIGANWTAD